MLGALSKQLFYNTVGYWIVDLKAQSCKINSDIIIINKSMNMFPISKDIFQSEKDKLHWNMFAKIMYWCNASYGKLQPSVGWLSMSVIKFLFIFVLLSMYDTENSVVQVYYYANEMANLFFWKSTV